MFDKVAGGVVNSVIALAAARGIQEATGRGHVETLGCPRVSHMCACGHITQSVQHVVVDCMIYKAPDGFAGRRRPDAATRYLLEDLNIAI